MTQSYHNVLKVSNNRLNKNEAHWKTVKLTFYYEYENWIKVKIWAKPDP